MFGDIDSVRIKSVKFDFTKLRTMRRSYGVLILSAFFRKLTTL